MPPTTTRTGQRWSGSKRPQDFTGRQGQQIRAKLAEDERAGKLTADDVEQVRRTAYDQGYSRGVDVGLDSGFCDGMNELAAILVESGLLTLDQINAAVEADAANQAEAAE